MKVCFIVQIYLNLDIILLRGSGLVLSCVILCFVCSSHVSVSLFSVFLMGGVVAGSFVCRACLDRPECVCSKAPAHFFQLLLLLL